MNIIYYIRVYLGSDLERIKIRNAVPNLYFQREYLFEFAHNTLVQRENFYFDGSREFRNSDFQKFLNIYLLIIE